MSGTFCHITSTRLTSWISVDDTLSRIHETTQFRSTTFHGLRKHNSSFGHRHSSLNDKKKLQWRPTFRNTWNQKNLLTISSGAKIPNCTRFTVRIGAFESDVAISRCVCLTFRRDIEVCQNFYIIRDCTITNESIGVLKINGSALAVIKELVKLTFIRYAMTVLTIWCCSLAFFWCFYPRKTNLLEQRESANLSYTNFTCSNGGMQDTAKCGDIKYASQQIECEPCENILCIVLVLKIIKVAQLIVWWVACLPLRHLFFKSLQCLMTSMTWILNDMMFVKIDEN